MNEIQNGGGGQNIDTFGIFQKQTAVSFLQQKNVFQNRYCSQ